MNLAVSDDDFEGLDWEDLKRSVSGATSAPEVTVSLVKKRRAKAGIGLCRAYAVVWFRAAAGDWVAKNGPTFNVQIAGDAANFLRVVPDVEARFSAFDFKGVKKLSLSIINVWPDESRRGVEASYKITAGGLVVILPDDFAKAVSIAGGPHDAAIVRTRLEVAGNAVEARVAPANEAFGGVNPFPSVMGGEKISPVQGAILSMLLRRKDVHQNALICAGCPGSPDLFPTIISNLIVKMEVLGVSIERLSGNVYRLAAGSKVKLSSFIEKAGGVAR